MGDLQYSAEGARWRADERECERVVKLRRLKMFENRHKAREKREKRE